MAATPGEVVGKESDECAYPNLQGKWQPGHEAHAVDANPGRPVARTLELAQWNGRVTAGFVFHRLIGLQVREALIVAEACGRAVKGGSATNILSCT